MKQFLQELRNQTLLNVGNNLNIFKGDPHFCIHAHRLPLDKFLHYWLDPLRIEFILRDDRTLSLIRRDSVNVCQLRILDDHSKPLAATSVTCYEQGRLPVTWTTDDNGFLFFALGAGPASIHISHTGFISMYLDSFAIPVLWLMLSPAISELDKATVYSYGKIPQRFNPSSSVSVRFSNDDGSFGDNVLEGLKAIVPGLLITDANGVMESGPTVQIRGRNSIAQQNGPLVVIDGMPVFSNNAAAGFIGSSSAQGVAGSNLLSPFSLNMIGEATVLKDAASTAIYGSRGANGVLLLSTRADTAGKGHWSFNAGTGTSSLTHIQSPLPTRDYLAVRRAALTNDGLPINAANLPEAYLWDSTRYTNFKKKMIGAAGIQFDMSGSFREKDRGGYASLTGAYHHETSTFLGQPGDDRGTLMGNLFRRPANRHQTWQGSFLYTLDHLDLPVIDFTNYTTLAPNAPFPYDKQGKPIYQMNGLSFLNYDKMVLDSYSSISHTLFGHLLWTDTLFRGLVFKASGGFTGSWVKEHISQPAGALNPLINPVSSVQTNKTLYNTLLIEPILEYARRFRNGGRMESLLGCTWQQQITSLGYSTINYKGDTLTDNSIVSTSENSNRLVYRYEALFARINYIHKGRYLVNVSFRGDGSSRFGPGKQFGAFGAVGMAWIFSDTRLFRASRFLQFGKLRANYGTVGNDQIGDYQYVQLWNNTTALRGYQGVQGVTLGTAYNPNLQWEVNHKLEGGMELGLLKNRIGLSVTYFYHWSGSQLVFFSLPLQTGYPGVVANIPARVVNKGFEGAMTVHVLPHRRFKWDASFLLTIPSNRLASFPGLANSIYANTLTVGKSLSELKGYVYTGVSRDSGLFTFGKGITTIGNTDVRYYGGISNRLSFKGISLDILVEFRHQNGLSALPQLYRVNPPGEANNALGLNNQLIDPRWYWKQPGSQAMLQKPTATPGTDAYNTIDKYVSSSAQITDASFIRFKSVSLGYRLREGWLKPFGAKFGQFYIEAKNFLTITHYLVTDPETQSPYSLPPLKTIRCGIHLTF
jgi:TonB-linked SusC/RagA family outer membrane protein